MWKLTGYCLKNALAVFLTLVILVAGMSCITIKAKPDAEGITTSPATQTEKRDPGPTGTISAGQEVQAVSQSVSSSGGTINISKPGDPLDGFAITVPPKSFKDTRTFKVSYAAVNSQTFGKDFNAISPLITVDNGGGYSDEVMTVKVPVKIPKGHFAMGFFYDEKTKKLEGIPTVATDGNSVTLATRHFSHFIISSIASTLLFLKDIDSGFWPGRDDFQIVNYGSYITPNGECAGQSFCAMWYYNEKYLAGAGHLWDISDNNGNAPKTPELWPDDNLAYRLSCVAQLEYKNYHGSLKDLLIGISGPLNTTDNNTHQSFAYAMLLTGQPQFAGISKEKTAEEGGGYSGHALVVYKVSGSRLWVADPNLSGRQDRTVEFVDGNYKPYNTAQNKTELEKGKGKNYPDIFYYAKSALVEWAKLSSLWEEYEAGTIGNDKFPKWVLTTKDSQGKDVNLADMETTEKVITVKAPQFPDITYGAFVDGKPINTADSKITLKPGNNKIGFLIYGMVNKEWEYVDFKYYNVVLKDATQPAPAAKYYRGTVTVTQVADGCTIHVTQLWDTNGKNVGLVPVDIKAGGVGGYITYQFSVPPGEYIVKHECICSHKGAPDTFPLKETKITVTADGLAVKVTCPQ